MDDHQPTQESGAGTGWICTQRNDFNTKVQTRGFLSQAQGM
jgi:hypothetical protein